MNRIILTPKAVSETVDVVFSFLAFLAVGETLSSATVTASVYSGTDATPSSIIDGADVISGANVTQSITAGTVGVVYNLVCVAVTSTGQNLIVAGYLGVVPT